MLIKILLLVLLVSCTKPSNNNPKEKPTTCIEFFCEMKIGNHRTCFFNSGDITGAGFFQIDCSVFDEKKRLVNE